MPYIGGIPVTPGDQVTAADNSCTETRADPQVNKIGIVLAGSKIVFTQRTQIRIFLNPNRQGLRQWIETMGNLFNKIYLRPSKIDCVIDHTVIRIHFTRRTDSNTGYRSGALSRKI